MKTNYERNTDTIKIILIVLILLLILSLSSSGQAYKVTITDYGRTTDTIIIDPTIIDSMIIQIFNQPYSTEKATETSNHFGLEKDYVYFYCEKGILNKKGKWKKSPKNN